MAHYIINTIAFQLFFLIIYDLFLKKETFFNWNRTYLLVTSMLSLIIPFIKINRFKDMLPQEFLISLPEVIIGNTSQTGIYALHLDKDLMTSKSIESWELVLYVGLLLATLLFLIKVTKLILVLTKNPKNRMGHLLIVNLQNSNAAFSCFHYIFLGEQINEKDKASILKHEMVHVKQKHTLDLLFFEVLRILFWFNPLVYMYQNRMMQLHEFIADSKALKHQSKKDYYENLLSQVFQTKNMSFINPFFKQSLIKKRIVMLQKSQSKQINLLKYALLIPMVLGMLVYSSCSVQNELVDQLTNLSQYTYSMKMGEEMSDEISNKHIKYEAFLKAHSKYVGWAQFDNETKTATYSIHTLEEKVPDNFSRVTVNFKDGASYISYMEFANKTSKEMVINKGGLPAKDYLNELDVPFSVIDQIPVFPGCEDLSKAEQKNCISRNIARHVNRNFNTELATELGLFGRQRINVIFKINKEGNIVDVRSRAPHPGLEAEAIRVIKTLPKMIPGEHQGKKVNVPYSLPIIFQVADEIPSEEEKK